MSEDVTLEDTSEDVDEESLDIGVFVEDLKSSRNLFCVGSSAHIQEIGRFTSVQFNDVHSGHGQTSSVHHASDVTI